MFELLSPFLQLFAPLIYTTIIGVLVIFMAVIISSSIKKKKAAQEETRRLEEMHRLQSERARTVNTLPSYTRPVTPSVSTNPAPISATPNNHSPKPFSPPFAQKGFTLAYSYEDVELDSTDEQVARAKIVPPKTQLTPQYTQDGKGIEICYGGHPIGTMRSNKLLDMALEFAADDRKDLLAVSLPFAGAPRFALYLYLSVDELARRWKSKPSFKKCTLVGNSNEDMQSTIGLCEAGEKVAIEWDSFKEKYLASSGGDIGYLPASMSDYMDAHKKPDARILSITEKDSGKYAVTIMMIAEDV